MHTTSKSNNVYALCFLKLYGIKCLNEQYHINEHEDPLKLLNLALKTHADRYRGQDILEEASLRALNQPPDSLWEFVQNVMDSSSANIATMVGTFLYSPAWNTPEEKRKAALAEVLKYKIPLESLNAIMRFAQVDATLALMIIENESFNEQVAYLMALSLYKFEEPDEVRDYLMDISSIKVKVALELTRKNRDWEIKSLRSAVNQIVHFAKGKEESLLLLLPLLANIKERDSLSSTLKTMKALI